MDEIKGNVLIVGDGDFSFTVAYATKRKGDTSWTVTTSTLLNQQQLFKLHKHAESNVSALYELGVCVMYEIDATKLSGAVYNKFDKIIFNFPHIGGKSNIKENRKLLKNFFQSAAEVLGASGEVLVTLARGQGGTPLDEPVRQWHDSWQVIGQAAYSGWILQRVEPFNIENYPEYGSTGFRSLDRQFYTKDSKTYFFKRGPGFHPQDCGYDETRKCLKLIHRKQSQRTRCLSKHHPIQLVAARLTQLLLERFAASPHCTASGSDVTKHDLSTTRPEVELNCDETSDQTSDLSVQGKNGRSDSANCRIDSDTVSGCEDRECSNPRELNPRYYCCSVNELTGNASGVGLRTSLFEADEVRHELSELRQAYIASGDVYRRTMIDSDSKPPIVAHELIFVCPSKCFCGQTDSFQAYILMCIEQILSEKGTIRTVSNSKHETPTYYGKFIEDVSRIEYTYTSKNRFSTASCNQVLAIGKPDPKLAESLKEKEMTRIVGYWGYVKSEILNYPECNRAESRVICAMFDLDTLAVARHDIPDYRLLWSEDPAFMDQFTTPPVCGATVYKPLSLHPPLWRHDLSFWENENEDVNEATLVDIISGIAGDSVSKVMLVNVWRDPETGLISRCYRVVYQSLDRPLSHRDAHDLQNAIRLTVADHLKVTLR